MPSPPGYELLTVNLRRLTEAKKIPLTVLADRAGIDRRELFAAMAGEVDPDLDWLNKLADVLGVEVTELLRDDKRDRPPPF